MWHIYGVSILVNSRKIDSSSKTNILNVGGYDLFRMYVKYHLCRHYVFTATFFFLMPLHNTAQKSQ